MPTSLLLFQVDAFTRQRFSGNPAAVCPLTAWLSDNDMQQIATENNLSETAFLVKRGDLYEIRWFTPVCEIDLCGHATLAAAFVIVNFLDKDQTHLRFKSKSGPLDVTVEGDRFILDFPAFGLEPCTKDQWPFPNVKGEEFWYGKLGSSPAFVAVLRDAKAVQDFSPVFSELEKQHADLLLTAKGEDVDFVSRFFAPWAGIPEDPVTGSAHCLLTPFWARKLGKQSLTARQVSRRGGELFCELKGDRVALGGHAVLVIRGEFFLGD